MAAPQSRLLLGDEQMTGGDRLRSARLVTRKENDLDVIDESDIVNQQEMTALLSQHGNASGTRGGSPRHSANLRYQ